MRLILKDYCGNQHYQFMFTYQFVDVGVEIFFEKGVTVLPGWTGRANDLPRERETLLKRLCHKKIK